MKKAIVVTTITSALLAASAWTATAQEEKSVSLVLGSSGSPFYQAMQCGAKAKAKELGLSLTVSAADQFAADAQIPVINAVTAAGPKVAAIVPTDMQALIPPMRELSTRGTKVITVDQTIADTSFVHTQILTDNEAGGGMAADQIASLIGKTGKVLVITQPPGSLAQDARAAGFEKTLKEKYPQITFLGAQYQSNDPQKAAEIVTSTLSAHPDLAGIFSTNDQGAIGAVTGLRQAGAVGRVKMVAYDAASAEVAALKKGDIQALIAQNPKLEGEVAMETAAKLIAGEKLQPVTMTEIVAITSGNLELAKKYEYIADCM
ncbi:ABC transporter substrate-binding protein [Agrobacterium larrymoorei]|uniref:Ribose transport system substrate-binding protein n=1 Tax=Agrobacterium larrymoorei TaxID=160699 RepID=A0AAJ2BF02_9HYPH|nr:ABC transporter substrate-binding protein [Agrobacterium larrymoorei]MDQ1182886.1 ribose transport system substrate-binding protein [Agrobacterium larrymoorei]MDR6101721.1 ribose transport system substrate-binding protein [Agrobacterium larrymoorei]